MVGSGTPSAQARLGVGGLVLFYVGFAAGVVAATWPLAASPGGLWPPHHDPRLFTWVMASMAPRLLTDPWHLFQGNAFYPYGQSLAFSEPLLLPSVLGLPGFVGGNPVLTYNLLLLLLWPLNGAAMAWAAYRVTGSRPAAWLAGAVFCLSPYFTEYHLEFQMLLAAPLPVMLVAWVRWLETERPGWLALALLALAVQGWTTWYYTIIGGFALVVLSAGYLALRWHGWRWARRLLGLGLGGVALAAVLLPVAWPYVVVYRELGFERDIGETAAHSADLLTFLEPGGRSLWYHFAPASHTAETSAFVGFSVVALAALGALWLRREPPLPAPARRLGRGLGVALVAGLGIAGLLIVLRPSRHHLGGLVIHPRPTEFLDLAVVLGLALLVVRGWAAWRARRPRALDEGEWVRLLALLVGVFALFALGPVIHVGTEAVAPGPYLSLYHVLLPLHAVRITTRFAVAVLAGLGLLAALGLAALEARLPARPARWLVRVLVFGAVAVEYAVSPVAYEPVAWAGRPVDRFLAADPADVALLEWPTNVDDVDADAMFRSLVHGKRVVNGVSGFVPASLRDLSGLLSDPGPPFPVPGALAALREMYPLRYLVVRLADPYLTKQQRAAWRALRQAPPPLLRFRATVGQEDVWELVPLPQRGVRIERSVSFDFLRRHPVLRLGARPLVTGTDLEQWVEVDLNGHPVGRSPIDRGPAATLGLAPPFNQAAANVISLDYRYRRPPGARGARYRIGTTGALSPGDLRLVSVGGPELGTAAIQLDGVELSPDHRGYNLVALDPAGRLLGATAFDTFADRTASPALAGWVAALPPGAIVAGTVRDEASERLTGEAVAALRSLGVARDLRGHYREGHAFVGVKGAPPGSALEALGPQPLELSVGRVEWIPGRPETRLGLELDTFELLPAPEGGPRP